VPAILPQYEKMRRVRTDVIQAEARKNGLRFDTHGTAKTGAKVGNERS
jgi:hypothetical protein